MNKKKILTAVLAVCLVAAMTVGATLAYFTSKTEDVVNTFTVGNVDIDLTEPSWNPDDGKDLQPGAVVKKDPKITNTGVGDGYVMIQVTGMDAMVDFSAEYDAANWTLVDADGNVLPVPAGNALVDGYYVYNKGALAPGTSTPALFSEVVFNEDAAEVSGTTHKIMGYFQDENGLFTYKDENGAVIEANKDRQPTVFADAAKKNPKVVYKIQGVDKVFDTAAEAEEYVLTNFKDEASFVFNLTVKGYAIQTTGINFTPYTNWVPELTGAVNP